jgi:hypothetical protein
MGEKDASRNKSRVIGKEREREIFRGSECVREENNHEKYIVCVEGRSVTRVSDVRCRPPVKCDIKSTIAPRSFAFPLFESLI